MTRGSWRAFSIRFWSDDGRKRDHGNDGGDHGDGHVRFALIENEARIRQAVRGIKAMFKADGVLKP